MALRRRKILKEMLDLGFGTTTVPADSGGSLVGEKIGLHSFFGSAVVNPGDFTGSDFGAMVLSAYNNGLPATGGFIDATGLSDSLTIGSDMTLGTLTKPTVLLLRPGQQLTLSSATLTLGSGTWIVGVGAGRETGSPATIKRLSGTKTMIAATGTSAVHTRNFGLRGLYLDGGGSAGHGIVLEYCDTAFIYDVQCRNGSGAVSAFRLVNDVWDFWITNSLFMAWGNSTTPVVNIAAGSATVTDGHWHSCVIGDLDASLPLGMPLMESSANTVQQRFVDCKFHNSGTGMTHAVNWGGYRTDFIGSTFQGAQSATNYILQFTSDDNRIIGGGINDLGNADGIRAGSIGDLTVEGFTVRSENSPGTGSGIKLLDSTTNASYVSVSGCHFINVTKGIDCSGTGAANVVLGPNHFVSCTTNVDSAGVNFTWSDVNHGKSIVTGSALKIGTTPASSGAVRLTNNTSIISRNAANGGDVGMAVVNTSDQLELFGNAFKFISGGHFVAGTDNTSDIGQNGSLRPRNIYNSGGIQVGATTDAADTGAVGFIEISDPSAPPSNEAKLYCKDNGSGKTQLVVRFPTGAVQVIATEP